MDKQQLQYLEEEIKAGTIIHDEYSPARPCPSAIEENGPYEYAIEWQPAPSAARQHVGHYFLALNLWSDYYHHRATRAQPSEEGWATLECVEVRSPYLSDLLAVLEDRSIPLPAIRISTWSNPCPGVYVRGTWTKVSAAAIGTPLPSPAQQVGTAAIARDKAPTMKVKCVGCDIDMVVPRQPAHDWWCPICALKPDA